MRALIGVLVLATSCERSVERTTTPPPPPLGTTHVAPPGTMPPDTQAPEQPIAPVSAQRLETAVRALGTTDARLDHDNVVRALRELADSLEILAPHQSTDIDAVRRAADEIETSSHDSPRHADYVQFGLEAAARVFATIRPYRGATLDEYNDAVRELRRQLDLVDADKPLLDQYARVTRVFETSLAAVQLAFGIETTARR